MWITRTRYEELVQAEARALALTGELERLTGQVERERERADRATDAALLVHHAPPIAPTKPAEPERAMFEDDPEELRKMMKEYKRDPVGVLLREGQGDAGAA